MMIPPHVSKRTVKVSANLALAMLLISGLCSKALSLALVPTASQQPAADPLVNVERFLTSPLRSGQAESSGTDWSCASRGG